MSTDKVGDRAAEGARPPRSSYGVAWRVACLAIALSLASWVTLVQFATEMPEGASDPRSALSSVPHSSCPESASETESRPTPSQEGSLAVSAGVSVVRSTPTTVVRVTMAWGAIKAPGSVLAFWGKSTGHLEFVDGQPRLGWQRIVSSIGSADLDCSGATGSMCVFIVGSNVHGGAIVDIAPGRVTDVCVSMKDTDEVHGVLVCADGASVANGKVTVIRETEWGTFEWTTVSDEVGVFKAANVSEVLGGSGPWRVEARAGGFAAEEVVVAEWSSGAEPIRIVMKKASRIRGRCVGKDGSPILGVEVSELRSGLTCVSGATGSFETADLPSEEGQMYLALIGGGYAPRTVAVETKSKSGIVDLGAITLEGGGQLTGRVVDSGGAAVVKRAVYLRYLAWNGPVRNGARAGREFLLGHTVTDNNGDFAFLGVPSEPCEILLGGEDKEGDGELIPVLKWVPEMGWSVEVTSHDAACVLVVESVGDALVDGQREYVVRYQDERVGGKMYSWTVTSSSSRVRVPAPSPGVYRMSVVVDGVRRIELGSHRVGESMVQEIACPIR